MRTCSHIITLAWRRTTLTPHAHKEIRKYRRVHRNTSHSHVPVTSIPYCIPKPLNHRTKAKDARYMQFLKIPAAIKDSCKHNGYRSFTAVVGCGCPSPKVHCALPSARDEINNFQHKNRSSRLLCSLSGWLWSMPILVTIAGLIHETGKFASKGLSVLLFCSQGCGVQALFKGLWEATLKRQLSPQSIRQGSFQFEEFLTSSDM